MPVLKLKDDNIKDFIKEDRIIYAYTLYILNAFTNPRMNTPQVIKNSIEINKGDVEMSVETLSSLTLSIVMTAKDRLHTEQIANILDNNGYKIDKIEAGRLINRIGIGKYNKMCNIDKCRKAGYDYIIIILVY